MPTRRSHAPAISPRRMREDLRLSRERMARLLDVSAKTVQRWEEQDGLPVRLPLRSRLAQLQEIVRLGLVVYTPEGFAQFLSTPTPEFGGSTALQLIEIGQAERVLAALAADHEGLGY
ncbi:MAG: DUF2384 domain-containing protein [Chloroflexi bacterium]|nr:DUF2384 domain-containing protein [Chloroflexota bacterium]